MLEIPESTIIARQLNETVRGMEIKEVEAGHTEHAFAFYQGDPGDYPLIMKGRKIGNCAGIGSMIEMELGEYSFLMGDGTNIRYYAPGVKLPADTRQGLRLWMESSLICTVQMYGTMLLIEPASYDNFYYTAAKTKPFPGTEDFDYAYFTELREELPGKTSIKGVSGTKQRIPGLGNGVLQDILLEAGHHPKRKIGTIREEEWKRTYDAVLHILEQMLAAGGRNTEKDLFGNPGGYYTKLSKHTVGKPCPYCGNIIQKMSYLGGTVYFCPSCQTLG